MKNFDNYECDGQMSIFDYKKVPYKIKSKIRLIELFAGVGSQAMALRDIGADFEHYRVVEFDKYAIASYNAIHDTDFPTMDVTKITGDDLGIVDTDKYTYMLTYSFPCTDLSVAGKMLGMEEGSGTRSSLLWEVKRLLEECKQLPQLLVMENVPQVHSKSNMPHFQKWLDFLESKGYCTYWKDLNAKNYGVAQSRNRTIAVSVLGNYTYTFPDPYPLTKVMKDYLEPVVDEKYYLKSEKARELIDKLIKGGKILTEQENRTTVDFSLKDAGVTPISNCICARYDKGVTDRAHEGSCVCEINVLGNYMPSEHDASRVVDTNGVAPTVKENHGTVTGIVEVKEWLK